MLINDLAAHLAAHRSDIQGAIERVLNRSWLVLGPEVADFEGAFAAYIGTKYCRSVASGTDALELALRALGATTGDRIATVANAGMYATTAILANSAEPIFMDVNLESRLVTCDEVDLAIRRGARFVVVTHLYGRAIPEIQEIADLCRRRGVALVEDCAQAHGAKWRGKTVGSFGDAGCFSFYPTKNLGAVGDGGTVVCDDGDLAAAIGKYRQYGWSVKYRVEFAGARNSRLDEIQAAVLSDLLPYLDGWNERRRDVVARYHELISHPEVIVPTPGREDDVEHLCVVRSPRRDDLREHLKSRNIATDIHYPIPDYRQPIFGDGFADLYLANTEQLTHEVLTLPCYPEMTDDDVFQVIHAVNSFAVESERREVVTALRPLYKSV